jgi:hypothetical protein
MNFAFWDLLVEWEIEGVRGKIENTVGLLEWNF